MSKSPSAHWHRCHALVLIWANNIAKWSVYKRIIIFFSSQIPLNISYLCFGSVRMCIRYLFVWHMNVCMDMGVEIEEWYEVNSSPSAAHIINYIYSSVNLLWLIKIKKKSTRFISATIHSSSLVVGSIYMSIYKVKWLRHIAGLSCRSHVMFHDVLKMIFLTMIMFWSVHCERLFNFCFSFFFFSSGVARHNGWHMILIDDVYTLHVYLKWKYFLSN